MKRADPLILNEYLRNCGNITLTLTTLKTSLAVPTQTTETNRPGSPRTWRER